MKILQIVASIYICSIYLNLKGNINASGAPIRDPHGVKGGGGEAWSVWG